MILRIFCVALLSLATAATGKVKNIEVSEATKAGTVIFNLNEEYFKNEKVSRRFSVQQTNQNVLTVDNQGNVILEQQIDFEQMCTTSPCTLIQTVTRIILFNLF